MRIKLLDPYLTIKLPDVGTLTGGKEYTVDKTTGRGLVEKGLAVEIEEKEEPNETENA